MYIVEVTGLSLLAPTLSWNDQRNGEVSKATSQITFCVLPAGRGTSKPRPASPACAAAVP